MPKSDDISFYYSCGYSISNNAMTIPVNGYLAVYISNASVQLDGGNSDVWFDHISIKISKGHLREEKHYYPYGLPMAGIGAIDLRQNPNRRRYQGNEYIKALGLNWMSFGARQYDPQLGRFMSVDPLAAAGGQEMMSPYAAMGDEPVSTTDADGMMPPGHFGIKFSVPFLSPAGSGFSATNDGHTNSGFHPHTGLGAIGSNIRFREAVQLEAIEAALAVYYETTGDSGEDDGSGTATNLAGDGENVNGANQNVNDMPPWNKSTKTVKGKNYTIKYCTYSKIFEGGSMASGMRISIKYKGSTYGYGNINWVQTYITTSESNKDWQVDGQAKPLYYNKGNETIRSLSGSVNLDDAPYRDI